MIYKVTFHISTLYICQISSTQKLLTLQDMRIEKENLYMNSFYIQETSYMKWKANIA